MLKEKQKQILKKVVGKAKETVGAIGNKIKSGASAVKKEIDSVKKSAFPSGFDPRIKDSWKISEKTPNKKFPNLS